jgi:hypothetical protein
VGEERVGGEDLRAGGNQGWSDRDPVDVLLVVDFDRTGLVQGSSSCVTNTRPAVWLRSGVLIYFASDHDGQTTRFWFCRLPEEGLSQRVQKEPVVPPTAACW